MKTTLPWYSSLQLLPSYIYNPCLHSSILKLSTAAWAVVSIWSRLVRVRWCLVQWHTISRCWDRYWHSTSWWPGARRTSLTHVRSSVTNTIIIVRDVSHISPWSQLHHHWVGLSHLHLLSILCWHSQLLSHSHWWRHKCAASGLRRLHIQTA